MVPEKPSGIILCSAYYASNTFSSTYNVVATERDFQECSLTLTSNRQRILIFPGVLKTTVRALETPISISMAKEKGRPGISKFNSNALTRKIK